MGVLGVAVAALCLIALEVVADSGAIREMSIAPGGLSEINDETFIAPHDLKQKRARRACDATPSKATAEEKARYLEDHNTFRGKVKGTSVFKLEWDEAVAARAQAWADKCFWKHDYLNDCTGARLGQNLYMVGGGNAVPANNASKPIQSWYDEVKFYDYPNNRCSGGVCGHFTQVVWGSSVKLGCGVARCPVMQMEESEPWSNVVYTVCDYTPAGNMAGVRPFNNGVPCSECKSTTSGIKCENNECAACNPTKDAGCECRNDCNGQGSNDPVTCACRCNAGFSGDHCEKNCADCKNQPTADCVGWKPYCTIAAYKTFMNQQCPLACGFCTPCS